MSNANMKCPGDCGGRLKATEAPEKYRCTQCSRKLRQSVVDRLERFKRVADGDGPASEIAQAALEGVRE